MTTPSKKTSKTKRSAARVNSLQDLNGALGFFNGDTENVATASPPEITIDGNPLTEETTAEMVEAAAPVAAPVAPARKKPKLAIQRVVATEKDLIKNFGGKEVQAVSMTKALDNPAVAEIVSASLSGTVPQYVTRVEDEAPSKEEMRDAIDVMWKNAQERGAEQANLIADEIDHAEVEASPEHTFKTSGTWTKPVGAKGVVLKKLGLLDPNDPIYVPTNFLINTNEDAMLKAQLLETLAVEPTSQTAILIELLKASDVSDLLADYAVTFDRLDADDAEDYAKKFVARIMATPLMEATDRIVKDHTAQLVALAQKLEAVLKHDVVIGKLTADQFQGAAIAAIKDAGVLRSAVLELGRVLELKNINEDQTVASLPQLVAIIRHAATRVDVVNAAADRLRTTQAEQRETIDSLRAELAKQVARNDALSNEMASLIDARNVIPEGLSPRPVLITDGNKRFLSRTDGKERSAPINTKYLEWLPTADKALTFKTEPGARKAAERLVLGLPGLRQQLTDAPESIDPTKLSLAGVNLDEIRYAKHGVIVSMH